VGDKTIMFRLCDSAMYDSMEVSNQSAIVERGMALHKLLRLLTATLGGEGYLTFMGNEFGHPEWIDFPREGNGWSYHYCRRQWSLAEDPKLKYRFLLEFEKKMVAAIKKHRVLSGHDSQLLMDNARKTLAYRRGSGIFAFNFHPTESYPDLRIPVPEQGDYRVMLSTDDFDFGGQGRIHHMAHTAQLQADGTWAIQVYLPARTAMVLKKEK